MHSPATYPKQNPLPFLINKKKQILLVRDHVNLFQAFVASRLDRLRLHHRQHHRWWCSSKLRSYNAEALILIPKNRVLWYHVKYNILRFGFHRLHEFHFIIGLQRSINNWFARYTFCFPIYLQYLTYTFCDEVYFLIIYFVIKSVFLFLIRFDVWKDYWWTCYVNNSSFSSFSSSQPHSEDLWALNIKILVDI